MTKILIVEDEALIAEMVRDSVEEAGYLVSGIARTAAEAIDLAGREPPDLAIVDARLSREGDGVAVGAQLAQSGIGVLYASGNCDSVVSQKAKGRACLMKPFLPDDLVAAIRTVEEMCRGETLSQPVPRGLTLLGAPG
jgi:DNA-binding response OmpR family regulator